VTVACTVLGAGAWGTALAVQLARMGQDVVLWDRNADRCASISERHRNPGYLTEIELPPNLRADADLTRAVARADLVVPVVPSHAMRDVMDRAARAVRAGATICCASKGVEERTLATMAEVLADVLPDHRDRITVLSGPSFAFELARELPTAVVIAGPEAAAHDAAEAFHGGALRCYTTDDVVGVCMGGSLKNVIAIACGVSDGLGLGHNARAALITRGLAEITRTAVVLGANPLTMMGLAGLGDLVLTCSGNLSRNRRVGLALAEGKDLDAILRDLGGVAEGVVTARSAKALRDRVGVEMPIAEIVYALLYEGLPVKGAIRALLERERKDEKG
jgi:glycerol-3-phosphate dehydrogenase (NAD(P)+)